MHQRIRSEALKPERFLQVDRSPQLKERLRAGEIVIAPAGGKGSTKIPSGLIHDWIGQIFIPDVTGRQVIENARAYDRYAAFYQPSVLKAKTFRDRDGACSFSMLIRQKVMFVDAALDGDYECEYSSLPPRRWYSRTTSIRLREILNYEKDNERAFAPDMGDGFIWRMDSVAKYEEADGGVYIELEAAALSRPIPASLRWMVTGVVERISRLALTTTLRQTREVNLQERQTLLSHR